MIKIIGAGMAGLLAGNLLRQHVRIIEEQSDLPNNHSAVLRFRTNKVGEALGIPFKPVTMVKSVLPWRNPVADALAYSSKNSGVARSDRSITDGTVVAERFIAPSDLIERMAMCSSIEIDFGKRYDFSSGEQVISTIPMPALMEVLKWPYRPVFNHASGLNIRAMIRNCDAYVSLMVPDPDIPFSRASITGNELIVEVPRFSLLNFNNVEGGRLLSALAEQNAEHAANLLGINPADIVNVSAHPQPYAKIMPIDDEIRREFIYWATHTHNVYSLGRFATWRPRLLLDDLLKDIEHINRWIASNNRYAVARQR